MFKIDQRKQSISVTIENGAALSNSVDLKMMSIVGFKIPDGLAAVLTFQNAYQGSESFENVYDSAGNELSVAATGTARFIHLEEIDPFLAFQQLKIRNNTAASPTNVSGDKIIEIIVRQID